MTTRTQYYLFVDYMVSSLVLNQLANACRSTIVDISQFHLWKLKTNFGGWTWWHFMTRVQSVTSRYDSFFIHDSSVVLVRSLVSNQLVEKRGNQCCPTSLVTKKQKTICQSTRHTLANSSLQQTQPLKFNTKNFNHLPNTSCLCPGTYRTQTYIKITPILGWINLVIFATKKI